MDFPTHCFNSLISEAGTMPNLPPRETATENTFEGLNTTTIGVSESSWKQLTCTQDWVNTNHLLVRSQIPWDGQKRCSEVPPHPAHGKYDTQ